MQIHYRRLLSRLRLKTDTRQLNIGGTQSSPFFRAAKSSVILMNKNKLVNKIKGGITMITLFILAVLLVSIATYFLLSLLIGYGWAIFIVADIIVAIKVLCWIFKPKKKKTE